MITLPIGKALIAVEQNRCEGCIFDPVISKERKCISPFGCTVTFEGRSENVIFKLVDMPKEAKGKDG
ncbi:hypothetical protein FACS189461_1410 [Spirochaetia bacterium]|nr:hypothetical protein FACS189461_1410 [Spirochaetia bacterium]